MLRFLARMMIVTSCLFGLSACKALFGNYTAEDLERKRVAWFSADQPPEQLEGHTFYRTAPKPQENSGFIHAFQYFSPDGAFYEFASGDSLIRSGRWKKKSTDGILSTSEELCFDLGSGEDCLDFDDWSENNITSHKTDYMNLASREYAPCQLGNTSTFSAFFLIMARNDINRNDTQEESKIGCKQALRSIVSKEFFGDETTKSYEQDGIVKHMSYCMRSLPESSLLASEDDREQFRKCNHQDMRPIAIQRAHEFLIFGAANRDYSIYSKARRQNMGVE